MKKILLVIEKKEEILKISSELRNYDKKCKIYISSNREETHKKLAHKKADVIVLNTDTPGFNTDELLIEFDRMFPQLPKVIINPKNNSKKNAFLLFNGIVDYLEEPFYVTELAEKVNKLLALNNEEFQQKVLTLPSFIKLIAMDKKTCTLTVKSNGSEGHLFFVDGELIESTVDDINGEHAVQYMLDWKDIEINRIIDHCDPVERTIYSPVDQIIAKALDKKNSQKEIDLKGEENMNKELFEHAQATMVHELGDGLVACSFWVSGDGQPLVSYEKVQAMNIGAANALFDRVTKMIKNSLIDSEFPVNLNQYYMIDLTGNMIALVVQIGDYQWGMLVDTTQASLGLILNVALPKAMKILSQKS